jgi:hypothetical protein
MVSRGFIVIRSNKNWIGLRVIFLSAASPITHSDHPTVAVGGDISGPVTTLSAVSLTEGALSFGLQMEYQDLDEVSDPRLREAGERYEPRP